MKALKIKYIYVALVMPFVILGCNMQVDFVEDSGIPGSGSMGQQDLIIQPGTGLNGNWNTLDTILTCPDPNSLTGCQLTITNQDSIDHQVMSPSPCQSNEIIMAGGGQWTCVIASSFEGSLNNGHIWISTSGARLYQSHCSSCHGPFYQSAKAGTTATTVEIAIRTISDMSGLSTLSSSAVQSIGDFLSSVVGAPTNAPPLTGEQLYSTYCSSCHRPLANSRVAGASAQNIEEAIQQKEAMNSIPALVNLTPEQINLIAEALNF